MAALVQRKIYATADWSAGAGGVAFAFDAACTAGNFISLMISIGTNVRTVSSITESGGTTTYNDPNFIIQGDAGTIEGWWAVAAGASPGTGITITLSGNTGDGGAVVLSEYTGMNTSSQAGATTNESTQVAATAHNSGSVTPANANGVIECMYRRTSGTWTEDGAFTLGAGTEAANNPYAVLLNNGSATEYNATSADAEISTMLIVAWAGADAAATVKNRMLLGVG